MSITYSTGPIENAIGFSCLPGESYTVFVKVLNNSKDDNVKAKIKLFSLNGKKDKVFSEIIEVSPLSSKLVELKVADLTEFEIQIKLNRHDDVLISAFGKNRNGNLVPSHRVLHSEFTIIDERWNLVCL